MGGSEGLNNIEGKAWERKFRNSSQRQVKKSFSGISAGYQINCLVARSVIATYKPNLIMKGIYFSSALHQHAQRKNGLLSNEMIHHKVPTILLD